MSTGAQTGDWVTYETVTFGAPAAHAPLIDLGDEAAAPALPPVAPFVVPPLPCVCRASTTSRLAI